MIHSAQYKQALEHNGKKVVVVGACTSGVSEMRYLTKNP